MKVAPCHLSKKRVSTVGMWGLPKIGGYLIGGPYSGLRLLFGLFFRDPFFSSTPHVKLGSCWRHTGSIPGVVLRRFRVSGLGFRFPLPTACI